MKNTIDRRTLLAAAGLTLCAAAFAGVVTGSALGLIPDAHAAGRPLTVSPKRIAALDYAVLDMFTVWGETGRLVAAADPAPLGYLKAPEGIPLTGGLKTAPVAELQAAKPDLIVITGRLQRSEAELKAIAPVVLITPDQAGGALESYAENMRLAAGWVGKQREADAEIRRIEARVKAVREKAAGATVAVLMVNEGRVGMLPPGGRCSLISREFGFTNVVAHGRGAEKRRPEARRRSHQGRERKDAHRPQGAQPQVRLHPQQGPRRRPSRSGRPPCASGRGRLGFARSRPRRPGFRSDGRRLVPWRRRPDRDGSDGEGRRARARDLNRLKR